MSGDRERVIELVNELGSRVGHVLSEMVPPAALITGPPIMPEPPSVPEPLTVTGVLPSELVGPLISRLPPVTVVGPV